MWERLSLSTRKALVKLSAEKRRECRKIFRTPFSGFDSVKNEVDYGLHDVLVRVAGEVAKGLFEDVDLSGEEWFVRRYVGAGGGEVEIMERFRREAGVRKSLAQVKSLMARANVAVAVQDEGGESPGGRKMKKVRGDGREAAVELGSPDSPSAHMTRDDALLAMYGLLSQQATYAKELTDPKDKLTATKIIKETVAMIAKATGADKPQEEQRVHPVFIGVPLSDSIADYLERYPSVKLVREDGSPLSSKQLRDWEINASKTVPYERAIPSEV